MNYDHTISGLLRKRDDISGGMQALHEQMAQRYNDLDAIDWVPDALNHVGELEGRAARSNRSRPNLPRP